MGMVEVSLYVGLFVAFYATYWGVSTIIQRRKQKQEREEDDKEAAERWRSHQVAIIDKIMAMDADQALPPTNTWLGH